MLIFIKNYMKPKHLLFILIVLASCKEDDEMHERTYRMGFQNSAPRIDNIDLVLQTLDMWTTRADAAMITTEVPWEELLDGASINTHIVNNYLDLVNFYRDKNFKLWIYIDPQNGLDRTSDALALLAAGKSIADADIQLLYQKFTIAMDSILKPDHLGLALETNLIRDAASAAIYKGVKDAANNTAVAVHARNPTVPLSISVQVDHAWGKLAGGTYQGVTQDFIDFPFLQELGLSSYAYFGFKNPTEIPIDYYSRLVKGKNFPVFVTEGGWASASINTGGISYTSSPEMQRDYFLHHAHLLDETKATAVFQLLFTDLDVAALPASTPASIAYFASLGLVDINLQAKPALTVWDDLFKNRKLVSGN
jgi:hypothetical protein